MLFAFSVEAAQAAEKTPVAVELVLALDGSASVDSAEFALQIEGLAAAFRDPEVLVAIEDLKPFGAAIAVLQWGERGAAQMVVPFTEITSARDAKAFGFRAGLIRRRMWAGATSIVSALDDSRAALEGNEFAGLRRVIDVSGDGSDNGGGSLETARRAALAAGITVNGLPILADDAGLADYYRDHVMTGAASFVEPARDFADYARAIKEKLVRELRPPAS